MLSGPLGPRNVGPLTRVDRPVLRSPRSGPMGWRKLEGGLIMGRYTTVFGPTFPEVGLGIHSSLHKSGERLTEITTFLEHLPYGVFFLRATCR